MVAAAAGTTLAACELPGTTFVVTTTADGVDAAPGDEACETSPGNGVCTLRAAVMEANATPGTNNIVVATGQTYTLTIGGRGEDDAATGDLDVTESVAITGDATIDAGKLDRAFDLHAQALILDGPDITNGLVDEVGRPGGGAIRVAAGTNLVVIRSTISSGSVEGSGGAIQSAGKVALSQVTIEGNVARGDGLQSPAQPAFGGAIATTGGTLDIVDSTVRNNEATSPGRGGAIHAVGNTLLTIDRSTFADNLDAGMSGGASITTSWDVTVTRSTIVGTALGIVADDGITVSGSTVLAGVESDHLTAGGSILGSCRSLLQHSLGYNLDLGTTCGLNGPGDLASTDPELLPLAPNGGPTDTMLPVPTSPAVDVIPAGTPGLCDGSATAATDQRGAPRPEGSACDIGAVEGDGGADLTPLALVVDDPADEPDLQPGDGACTTAGGGCTWPAAVAETNAWPTPDAISIAPGVTPTVQPPPDDTSGVRRPVDITDDLAIDGNGATIVGSWLRTPLSIRAGTVTVDDLKVYGGVEVTGPRSNATLTDIDASSGSTSGVYVDEGADLSLRRSTVHDNALGVLVGHASTATIEQSTITDNNGVGVGGDGTISITRSTITPPSDGSAPALRGRAGGVPPSLRVRGSIVGTGPVGQSCAGAVLSEGYNVFHGGCGALAVGDRAGVLTRLAPLDDNGGATPTRRLWADSPAIDAIPVGTAGLCDASTPTDQRGSVRPVGVACDAGAVEGVLDVTPAGVRSFVVTSPADARDSEIGDGVCSADAGGCTLRAAIDEANGWPHDVTVTIAGGVHPTLALTGPEDDHNASGDIDIRKALTINGGGATVDVGGVGGGLDLHVGPSTINSLSVRHAAATGAAIRHRAGDLTINGSTIADNAGAGMKSEARLTVTGSTVTDNGGTGIESRTLLLVYGSTVSGNHLDGISGTWASTQAVVSVQSSTVSTNGGAGIRSAAGASTSNSTITGNGVGIATVGRAQVTASSITGNTGDGILASGGAAILRSTIAGNGQNGVRVGSDSQIRASTIDGNGRAGVSAFGWSTVDITASTIGSTSAFAAVEAEPTGSPAIRVAATAIVAGGAPGCTGNVSSLGYNRVTDDSCPFAAVGDLQVGDLGLAALASNGGPTPTRMPTATSTLVDAIPPGTAGACDSALTTDQRGQPRPQGAGCDVGAVERTP